MWDKLRNLLLYVNKSRNQQRYYFGISKRVNSNGSVQVDVGQLLRSEGVQRQLKEVNKLSKRQTILAIHNGKEPPEMVGIGRHTKESLRRVWNSEWQEEANKLGINLF